MAGLESISGSLKQKNGKRVVFKTFRKPSVNREGGKPETRMYLMERYERRTPPSEKEQAAKARFAEISERVNALSEAEKRQYAQEMHDAKMEFKGKKYSSLRGYIMARMYAET